MNLFQPSDENRNELDSLKQGTSSRRKFLGRSLASAAVVVPASLLVTQTANAASRSAFNLSAEQAFQEIKRDEDAHVSYLKEALGSAVSTKANLQEPQTIRC